jgi:hypothetical protein
MENKTFHGEVIPRDRLFIDSSLFRPCREVCPKTLVEKSLAKRQTKLKTLRNDFNCRRIFVHSKGTITFTYLLRIYMLLFM